MKLNTLIIFLLIFFSCDPIDDKLIIINPSQQIIYYVISPQSNLKDLYQEGLKDIGVEVKYTNYIKEIKPNSTKHEIKTGSGNAWERYINGACENGKLHLYTFNIDMLKKYSWEEIINNSYFVNNIEFSVQDLEKLNWKIKLSQ